MDRRTLAATALAVAACSGRAAQRAPQARDAGAEVVARGPANGAPAVDAARPSDAAPSPLAPSTIAAIDAVMRPWSGVKRPGCAVGVVRAGALVLARGYGMADVAGGVPIDADTVFDLGSTSKQLTAALVHLLVADGALRLDDPLTRYVPEIAARRGRTITIADLLHHTSGLPDYVDLLQDEGHDLTDVTTEADALRVLAAARPLRAPGVAHEYCNSNYFLLGLVVARVTGRPLAEVARDRLFAPLGMAHTSIGDGGRTPVPRMARGYDHAGRGWRVVASGWQQVGDGSVLSTVRDLARWDRELTAPTVGGQALVDAMLARGALDDGTVLDYASGLYFDEHDGRVTIAHSGAWVGFGAELLRFPAERVSVICLCNFDDSDPESIAPRIADAVLAEP